MRNVRRAACVATALATIACAQPRVNMNDIAERYVRLVLEVGQHDPDYVDAYYGDERFKPTGTPTPFNALTTEAAA